MSGIPAAPGRAVGAAWIWRAQTPTPDRSTTAASAAAPASLGDAARTASERLAALAQELRASGRPAEAEILDAQALMAQDPALLDAATARVAAGASPADAVLGAAGEIADLLAALDDELLALRATDVRDVAARIALVLTGERVQIPDRPSIVVADDLPPSIAAEIPPDLLRGIALAGSSPVAHAAILARSLGIPAVVGAAGLGDAVLSADRPPETIALDGDAGEVRLDPTDAEVEAFARPTEAAVAFAARASALRGRPATTADGHPVRLVANIGGPAESQRALDLGAEGVGLFRTEFLFLGRDRPPSEEEQRAAYGRVFEAFGPDRRVVVRLADIGGYKEIPYLGIPAEQNPFLGVRGIRIGRILPDLLVTQLRAVLLGAGDAGVVPAVMAPMVATPDDVALFRALVDEARASLATDGIPTPQPELGIMIEVPSAIWLAPELVREVAFVSVGTNDLTQYVLAADRTNPALSAYHEALQPAVLRPIEALVGVAHAAGVHVAVCGELAGRPDGAAVLVGLGVDELSMAASALDGVRLALSERTLVELRARASTALRIPVVSAET